MKNKLGGGGGGAGGGRRGTLAATAMDSYGRDHGQGGAHDQGGGSHRRRLPWPWPDGADDAIEVASQEL